MSRMGCRKRIADRLGQSVKLTSGCMDSFGFNELQNMAEAYICGRCHDVNRKKCPLEETQMSEPCCVLAWIETDASAEAEFFTRVHEECTKYAATCKNALAKTNNIC